MTAPAEPELSDIIFAAIRDLDAFERDFLAEGAAIDERERAEKADTDSTKGDP